MNKIKLAVVLPYEWFGHPGSKRWGLPLYHFLFKGFDQNDRIEVTRFIQPTKESISYTKLMNFDVLFKFSPWRKLAPEVIGIEKLKLVKFCIAGDFHGIDQEWKDSYREQGYDFCWYHTSKQQAYDLGIFSPYEDEIDYRMIMPGVDKDIYVPTPFRPRIKNKILVSGCLGGEGRFYRLRNRAAKNPNVAVESKKVNRGLLYPKLLGRYRASLAAVGMYTAVRYVESPMCGCLTFMEGTDRNYWTHLGFVDNETAIRVDENNYEQKFEGYIKTADDPKWEKIAGAGRSYVIKHWSNRVQVDKLIDIIEEFL